MGYLDIQQGSICLKCIDKKRKGTMVIKSGSFGKFLGCDNYPRCTNTEKLGKNLENEASKLLKEKRKKTRRSKRKNIRLSIEKKIERNQRKQRGQMFADFKRLIAE